MTIVANKRRSAAEQTRLGTARLSYEGQAGFWGTVVAVNSKMNSIDVRSAFGLEARGIPVASMEWVCESAPANGAFTGQRRLPPVGAYVFVMAPQGTAEGAFALCSAFPRGLGDAKDFLAADDTEKDKKDALALRVTQGAWTLKEDYATGNVSMSSPDGSISLEAVNADDDANNVKKKVALSAWGSSAALDGNGAALSTDGDIAITATGDSKGAFTVGAKKAISVTTESETDKITIGNGAKTTQATAATLFALIDKLLELLAGLKTVGSPASHSASPDFVANVTALKQDWGMVFV